MNLLFSTLASLLLVASSNVAMAFQPLVTDDTGTQGKGGNQLEFSYNQERSSSRGSTTNIQTLPTVYTRGLSDGIDAYVAAIPTRIRSTMPGANANGGGNPALGVKWRFYENESSKTSLGLKPEIRLPVSAAEEAAGLGTGRASYGLMLILTQEVPFGAVHVNLGRGRDLFREPEINPHISSTHTSIAPVWDVNGEWKLALDIGTESETAGGVTTRAVFLEIGAVFSPGKDLDLAFGIVRWTDNATPRATTTSATIGLTWRFR